MRILTILAILLLTAPARGTGGFWDRSSEVKGRVELINPALKRRSGPADASGVVVWLEPLDRTSLRGARTRRTINQRDKRFLPHVVAVEAGSQVEFPNDDPFFHNVFSIFNGRKFDLGLYASGETRPVIFNRPGISYIFCNIHPQMSAIVVALDSPYFAVTEAKGDFVIPGVPEGGYRLQVWHERAKSERLAELTRTVQVMGAGADLGLLRISEEGYVLRSHPNKHGEEYDTPQIRGGYRRP
jgi:plastocyanin